MFFRLANRYDFNIYLMCIHPNINHLTFNLDLCFRIFFVNNSLF